jgi:hypothetical protein
MIFDYTEIDKLLERRLEQGWVVLNLDSNIFGNDNRKLDNWCQEHFGAKVHEQDLSDNLDSGEWDWIQDSIIVKDKSKALLAKLALEKS